MSKEKKKKCSRIFTVLNVEAKLISLRTCVHRSCNARKIVYLFGEDKNMHSNYIVRIRTHSL